MEHRDRIKKLAAGIFFIASLAMIAWAVFSIGSDKGFTQPKFQMTALYHEVGGLAVGAPVTLSGVNVGTVADIDFVDPEVDGRGVKVILNIFKRFEKQLHKSTNFVIKTEGLLGEKIVDITTEPDYVRADLSEPVTGEDPLDVQNLAETFRDAAQSLQETSKSIDLVTQDMKHISGTTTRLLNRIEQRIIDGNLFKVF